MDNKQTTNQQEQEETLDFEMRLDAVKQIIQSLNNNNINLKEGLELYRKAQNHLTIANKMLEEAEFELNNVLEQK